MYWICKIPRTTYYGNLHDIRSPQSHLALVAPMTRLRLQALFQCSLLGQRGGIGVEDVEHPWMERLHDAQRVGRDCFIVLPRSNRLVPANIGLKECMTMICMHKKSTVKKLLSLMVTLIFQSIFEQPASQGLLKQRRL